MLNQELIETIKQSSKDEVIIFDKYDNRHKNKKIFRKYVSLGHIPKFDEHHKKSYMFSDTKDLDNKQIIDSALHPYLDRIKNHDIRYNQFVVNYYETGENYIEPHSDCDKDMIKDYRILVLSLGQTRTMRLTSRKNSDVSLEVLLTNESIFLFDEDLNRNYRHEILKDESIEPRISITARMMKI